jgi:hypothetical protein
MRRWNHSSTNLAGSISVDELVGATQVYLRLLARLSA